MRIYLPLSAFVSTSQAEGYKGGIRIRIGVLERLYIRVQICCQMQIDEIFWIPIFAYVKTRTWTWISTYGWSFRDTDIRIWIQIKYPHRNCDFILFSLKLGNSFRSMDGFFFVGG